MGYRTPFILMPDEECIDYETDVRAGELSVKDAYDLYLIAKGKEPKNYTLVCYMKVQFFFQDSKTLIWTSQEKKDFVSKWEKSIQSVWSHKILKYLKNGKKIVLDFKFGTQIEWFGISEHWEGYVIKTDEYFARSSVTTDKKITSLDDKDLAFAEKDIYSQRGAVHEFGHMLGIDDEYNKGNIWIKDKNSVMHSGEVIKARHLTFFAIWLNKKLTKYKIQ